MKVRMLVCFECSDNDERFMVPLKYRKTYMAMHAKKMHGHTDETLLHLIPAAHWRSDLSDWKAGRGRHGLLVWREITMESVTRRR